MADYIEKEGPSVEEATFSALMALGLSEDQAQVQVLAVGKTGRAKVRVAKQGVELPPADAAVETTSGLDWPTYQKPPAGPARRSREARNADEAELAAVAGMVERITERMGVPMRAERVERNGSMVVNLVGEREGLLIGKKGATLHALQLLASERVNRDARGEKVQIQVDVAGYRGRQEEKLMADAVAFADQAVAEDRQVATMPMTAADRRIVHLAIQGRDDVETFSVGEGEFKRVVIQRRS